MHLSGIDGIWKRLKRVEHNNVSFRSLSGLRVELRKANERLRHKGPAILARIMLPDEHGSTTPTKTSWRAARRYSGLNGVTGSKLSEVLHTHLRALRGVIAA